MHKCVRCSRIVKNLDEINDGCVCGSKVFTFIRGNEESVLEPELPPEKPKEAEKENPTKNEASGKAPESYFARMTFTSEDVENIKIMSEGVFLVDVNALSRNPVVVKDNDGVYYVRIGLEKKGKKPDK